MAIGMVLMKCVFMMVLSVGFVKSDVDKDREECATQLVGLATCLPYVGGTAKAPTPDCCTGLKQVLTTSKKCLCILIKDRNDPSLGLKINATLALGLPAICKTNSGISECPALLHLSPNSPDAKVFEDFNNIVNGTTTATPPAAASKETPKSGSSNAGGSSPPPKNNGGMKLNSWLGLKMVGGVLLWCLTSYY
ncbi:protein YLS3-like [Papaver somniferum]|uniref:protein YLS3-like n=1 Tax=Papaver somniferum TaxID=3469 RepID=UPI000E6F94C7|nr:protein YLS3-like [Papaver somniferum]